MPWNCPVFDSTGKVKDSRTYLRAASGGITMGGATASGSALKSSVLLAYGAASMSQPTASGVSAIGSSSYSLDLSGVSSRQHMQDWDANWISEFEEQMSDFEWQVDTGNGGQVGVWTGSGNPGSGGQEDVSNFIEAGPAAGMPVRVRMKVILAGTFVWASVCHDTDSDPRHHYEFSVTDSLMQFYKLWGPSAGTDWSSLTPTDSWSPTLGNTYWIYLTETRAGNSPTGDVTLLGQVLDTDLNVLGELEIQDTAASPQAGEAVIPSTNKRGFGGFQDTDGTGSKVVEWHVEPAL